MRDVQEFDHKFCHFSLRKLAVSVDVKLVENAVELCTGYWPSPFTGVNIIDYPEGFSSIESSTSVCVILLEQLYDHLIDHIVLRNLWAHKHDNEPCHLGLRNLPITVSIKLSKKLIEVNASQGWLTLILEELI